MMLVDTDTNTLYFPVSKAVAEELREWSEPCQLRVENGSFVVRMMAQPVKGVYITDDDRLEKQL